MPTRQLSGVVCAALTPLRAGLTPDVEAAVAHCRHLLENGCDGINLLGTTGEAFSLSVDQRLALMRAIAKSGLPLERFMVGTGAAAFADAVALTRAAVNLGFAGALVIPPFYFKNVSEEGVVAFYRALVRAVDDPSLRLYFYNFPQLSGVEIGLDVVGAIAAAFPETVAGLKDSSGAPGYAQSIASAFPDLAIFTSSEAALQTARSTGFAGCISATVNVTAPLAATVWRGEADPAARARLEAIRAAIVRYPFVPALRYLMRSRTGDARWEHVLPPLTPLAAQQRAALTRELATLGQNGVG